MIISEVFSLEGPRDRVSALLLDVQSVRSCIPGVTDVTQVSPTRYDATLAVQVGPIRSAFRGSITLDHSQSPERLKATARGKDRTTGSLATVTFDAHLAESAPNVTTVRTTADVSIRGRLGSFGTGVIQATAEQMIGDFVSCVNAQLSSAGGTTTHAPARPIPVLRTLLMALWTRVRTSFRSRKKRQGSTR
jgi:carbon monoxide dehydrogenase subunit G